MKAGRAQPQFQWLSGRWIRLEGLQMAELLFCEWTQSKQVLIGELMTLYWTVVRVTGFAIQLSRWIEKKIHLDGSRCFLTLKFMMQWTYHAVAGQFDWHGKHALTSLPHPALGMHFPSAVVMWWSCSFSQSCGSCDLCAWRGPFQGYAKVPQMENLLSVLGSEASKLWDLGQEIPQQEWNIQE